MNWDAIGAVGETVGALAVVVSLGYLAVQIRQQNRESRRSMTNSLTEQWNEFMGPLAYSDEMSVIWVRGTGGEELSPAETVRFWSHNSRYFRIVESYYLHHLDGILDQRVWTGVSHTLDDALSNPGILMYWENRGHWFCDELREYISNRIKSGTRGQPFSYAEESTA